MKLKNIACSALPVLALSIFTISIPALAGHEGKIGSDLYKKLK